MNRKPERRRSTRTTAIVVIGIGVLLLAAANGHLVYVAMTSQPECVDHARLGARIGATEAGDRRATSNRLSAARSACSPG